MKNKKGCIIAALLVFALGLVFSYKFMKKDKTSNLSEVTAQEKSNSGTENTSSETRNEENSDSKIGSQFELGQRIEPEIEIEFDPNNPNYDVIVDYIKEYMDSSFVKENYDFSISFWRDNLCEIDVCETIGGFESNYSSYFFTVKNNKVTGIVINYLDKIDRSKAIVPKFDEEKTIAAALKESEELVPKGQTILEQPYYKMYDILKNKFYIKVNLQYGEPDDIAFVHFEYEVK